MGFFHIQFERERQARLQHEQRETPADPTVLRLFAEIRKARQSEKRAWRRLARHLTQGPYTEG